MMAVKKMCTSWKRRNVPAGPSPTADLTLNFSGKHLSQNLGEEDLKEKITESRENDLMCHSGVPSVQNLFLLLHIHKEANRTICS